MSFRLCVVCWGWGVDAFFLEDSGHGGQTAGADVDPEKGYDDGKRQVIAVWVYR